MKAIWLQLRQRIVADKKRAGMLGVLLFGLGALVVKNTLLTGPTTGQAAVSVAGEPAPSPEGAGRAAIGRMRASMSEDNSGRFILVPVSPSVNRDLFAMDPAHFPVLTQTAGAQSAKSVTGEQPVESPPPNADDLRRLREAELHQEIKDWRLRSVLLSHNPTAVIETDGADARRSLLCPGQKLQGWSLREVGPGHAVLEKESVVVRLALAIPER